ncbi:hypothetical protein ACHAXR_012624 [Thalassiosira sp. AJA248-18]
MIIRMMLLPFIPILCILINSAVVSIAADPAAKDGTPTLDEDLFNRALAHAGTLESQNSGITDRLREGNVEALYEVAKSMNDDDDKISSVLIWHALADDGSEGVDYEVYDSAEGYDYEGHVPSAMALGFSYYDVDKPRSLHYFLMATSKKGKPHQAAMYNAGRLYLEMEDPSGALYYIRECAMLDLLHPEHARPQLTMTCQKAYSMLSNQLVENSDMGLEEAVECFSYAHMDNFPKPNSKEYQEFGKALVHLQKYMEVVRANSGEALSKNNSARTKAEKQLTAAIETLTNFQSKHRGGNTSEDTMSQLQIYLVGYIIQRTKDLRTKLNGDRNDEL